MGILAANFVVDVPDWPILLASAAGTLLAFELLAMFRRIWFGRRRTVAMGVTAIVLLPGALAGAGALASGESMAMLALLSGPLIFAGLAAYDVMASLGNPARKSGLLLREGFLGPAIVSLAVLVAYHPCGGSIIAIAACAVMWVFRSYSRTTSPINASWRSAMLGLRILAILLLAAWLARPGFDYTTDVKIPSIVLVGIDTSASMQRRDMPREYRQVSIGDNEDPVSRAEAVRRAMDDQGAAIQEVTVDGQADVFTFAIKSKPLALLRADSPVKAFRLPDSTEPATALGDCVNDAFSPYAASAQKVSAIVLITDGCNNTSDIIDPEKEADLMGSRHVPIFTVGVGSDRFTRSMRSLTVRDLRAPDKIEAFNRLPITASVELMGLKGKQIRVSAKFGEQEIEGAETFVADADQVTHPCRFTHIPLSAGYHRLTVTAQVVEGAPVGLEGTPAASKLVHVLDRELRVLYIEGKFRSETKYITQAIIAAQRFSLDRRIILAPAGQQPTPALSDNPDDWLKYHAIILGDVDASCFTQKQLAIIKDLVSTKGKGLCMIGGFKSFGRGGWANTPLADVLPIDLAASAEQIDMPLQVVPTDEGLRNEIMKIGADDTTPAVAWSRMGPLNGANKLGKPKPAAVVLAATPQKDPLIVMQNYGSGRALAIAFDTSWQWVLSPKDTSESQRRFWRQVTLYLAAPKGNVWIGTDRTSYEYRRLISGAEAVDVTAGVEDAYGAPSPKSLKEVTLSGPVSAGTTQPSKTVPVAMETRDNVLRAKLPPPQGPGIYILKITADIHGRPMTAEHRYEVLERDLESLDVLANFDLLQRMSTASGGKFEPIRNLPSLLKDLNKAAKPEIETRPVHIDFTKNARWSLVVVLMALFCMEWALRKRKGLV